MEHPDASKYWIVFDVDQTLLTDEKFNHLYSRQGDVYRFMYKGDHSAITPMVDLYNWCKRQGMNMCIITGRSNHLTKITQDNLVKVGVRACQRFYTKKGRENTIKYKEACRKEIIDAGGFILVNIGDREDDLLITDPNCDTDHAYGYAEYAIKLPSTY